MPESFEETKAIEEADNKACRTLPPRLREMAKKERKKRKRNKRAQTEADGGKEFSLVETESDSSASAAI